MHRALPLAWLAVPRPAASKTVVITTDADRRDVNNNYLDSHNGNIMAHGGVYYLYGERFGDQTLATAYPWKTSPRMGVHTSTDLTHWTYRGDPLPMVSGTLWQPRVWHNGTAFIMWLNAGGGWLTATSADGVHFTPANGGKPHVSRFGPTAKAGGSAVLIDDDGEGYVAFNAMPPGFDEPGHPGWPGHVAHGYGHIVSIERLTADHLQSSKVNVSGLFDDDFVEDPSLFKRNGVYYLTYGSACCGCSEGSGQVVWTAKSIHGPWSRQRHSDVNCANASALVCGAFSRRDDNYKNLIYDAQWGGTSLFPLANGDTQVLFKGRRWLSGPNLPKQCFDICHNSPPLGDGNVTHCRVGGEKYIMGSDNDVWYPLEFDDETGEVLPMRRRESYELQLPD